MPKKTPHVRAFGLPLCTGMSVWPSSFDTSAVAQFRLNILFNTSNWIIRTSRPAEMWQQPPTHCLTHVKTWENWYGYVTHGVNRKTSTEQQKEKKKHSKRIAPMAPNVSTAWHDSLSLHFFPPFCLSTVMQMVSSVTCVCGCVCVSVQLTIAEVGTGTANKKPSAKRTFEFGKCVPAMTQ